MESSAVRSQGVMEGGGSYNRHARIPAGGAGLAMPFLEQQHIVVDPGERLLAADVFGQVALVKLRPVAGWDIGRNSKEQAPKAVAMACHSESSDRYIPSGRVRIRSGDASLRSASSDSI